MSDVKRYNHVFQKNSGSRELIEHEEGDWCLYEDLNTIEAENAKLREDIEDIAGVIGHPGTIALAKYNLSESLGDRVRYAHRQWLEQTHAANQRVIEAEIKFDRMQQSLANARDEAYEKCRQIAAGYILGDAGNTANCIATDISQEKRALKSPSSGGEK